MDDLPRQGQKLLILGGNALGILRLRHVARVHVGVVGVVGLLDGQPWGRGAGGAFSFPPMLEPVGIGAIAGVDAAETRGCCASGQGAVFEDVAVRP